MNNPFEVIEARLNNIETQLTSTFNEEREKHKTLLEWVFK